MKITLEGTTFCITGEFALFRVLHDLEAAIVYRGGSITATVQPHTQVLVYSGYDNTKVDQARMQGIPLLNEAQMMRLLEEGWIEVAFVRPSLVQGECAFNPLIAEARSVLAEAPSTSTVQQLAELIERCEPETMPVLVRYLQDHTSTWTPLEQLLWQLPDSWMTSVIGGEDTVAYQLIRRLNLRRMALKNSEYKALFACSNFTHVQRIDFHDFKDVTKGALQMCSRQETMRSVQTLSLGSFKSNAFEGWEAQGSLRNVRALKLRFLDHSGLTHKTAQRIWGSSRMNSIEHLELNDCFQLYGLQELGTPACFPSLTCLTLHDVYPYKRIRQWMTRSVGPVVEHLKMWATHYSRHPPKPRFELDGMEALKILELSLHPSLLKPPTKTWDLSAQFLLNFEHLPPNLHTIRTNVPLDQKGIPLLMERWPHLEWIYHEVVVPL